MQNRKHQKKSYAVLQTIQWVLFAGLILLCYLFETSGSYHKPLVLIPVALCIASHTGEIPAMMVGAVCGLLLDLACGKLPGCNAIILVISCVMVSLLYRYLLKQKLWNMLFLITICVALQAGVDYVFYYAIWNDPDVELILKNIMIPCGMMTIISGIVFYFIIKKIAESCQSHRIQKLEKMNLFSDLD
ncbi:MAG: rod shape-determining protein MreD [Oscillospiraceae bacterium]|nr:rod shape-determining protein MreD [Oscillospiraceae bacterium]